MNAPRKHKIGVSITFVGLSGGLVKWDVSCQAKVEKRQAELVKARAAVAAGSTTDTLSQT